MRPNVCFKHMDNYVRDPTHSNIPSTRLIKELFSAKLVGLLHNHNGLHWGLSLMLHKGQRLHVLYLDSLNNRYPDLDHDLQLFWKGPPRQPNSSTYSPAMLRAPSSTTCKCLAKPTILTAASSS